MLLALQLLQPLLMPMLMLMPQLSLQQAALFSGLSLPGAGHGLHQLGRADPVPAEGRGGGFREAGAGTFPLHPSAQSDPDAGGRALDRGGGRRRGRRGRGQAQVAKTHGIMRIVLRHM